MIEYKNRKEPSGVIKIGNDLHKVVDFELIKPAVEGEFLSLHTFRVNTVEPTADEKLMYEIKHFDWYYAMSDDQRVWRAGDSAKRKLDAAMRTASDEVKAYYKEQCPYGK